MYNRVSCSQVVQCQFYYCTNYTDLFHKNLWACQKIICDGRQIYINVYMRHSFDLSRIAIANLSLIFFFLLLAQQPPSGPGPPHSRGF